MTAGFGRLWAATAVSNVGDGVALAAGPLLLASLTSDPALVAGAMFVQELPWLLFALPAGVYVDGSTGVADALRGRVNSGYFLFSVGGAALGAGGGLVARGLGITAPFWFAFCGMVVLTAVAWRRFSPALLDAS